MCIYVKKDFFILKSNLTGTTRVHDSVISPSTVS